MIEIDANEILYDLVRKHPKVKEIMVEIGFVNIVKSGMLQSVGKVMSAKKGSEMKGIEWDKVETIFREHGYLLKED